MNGPLLSFCLMNLQADPVENQLHEVEEREAFRKSFQHYEKSRLTCLVSETV